MALSVLARFACVLLAIGLTGCSKTKSDGDVSFGETKSTSGQKIRMETHNADLLETRFERESTIFRLCSGDIQVNPASITYRGQEIFVLPANWTSIKLVKHNNRLTIDIDGEHVATVDIAVEPAVAAERGRSPSYHPRS